MLSSPFIENSIVKVCLPYSLVIFLEKTFAVVEAIKLHHMYNHKRILN